MFIDSSAFISLTLPKDTFHNIAILWWNTHRGIALSTSNLVVIETLGWIRYHVGKKQAVILGERLLFGEGIKIERVTAQDEEEAWRLFQKVDGRGVSMIDCTTAILMKRLAMKDIFTFDQDFKRLGFRVYPS